MTQAAVEREVSSPSFFDKERFSLFNPHNVPQHIALIPDGNRRWAKARGLPPMLGHWEGAEVLTDIVCSASQLGVKTLTVYAFSTENWGRPSDEVDALMNVFELYLRDKREQMVRDGIRFDAIGNISGLPLRIQEACYQTKQATEKCSKINLVLAMNYGARDEIRRAIIKMFEENERQKISVHDLTENFISRHLDTHPWGDPDLMIRTSGELRMSNFLLWQMSYTEIYTTEVLWPEFSPQELLEAILVYQKRCRRIGAGGV
jgi:undecaprenyl diphosphate synthase